MNNKKIAFLIVLSVFASFVMRFVYLLAPTFFSFYFYTVVLAAAMVYLYKTAKQW